MNSLTDQQLLRDYTERRSEAAFAEVVRRHVDFVHSAAWRMVRDAQLAEDVTQGVFVACAQNARQLADHPVLAGWLHCTTRNLAANIVRSETRRRAREQESVAMNELLATGTDADWEHISPQLDAALGELDETDRHAVLMRYFQRKSAHEIGQVIGVSDEAAQKRVNRAVERLRELFAKRGLTTGAVGLATIITANGVQAAPFGLAAKITAATALALAGTTITTTTTVTKAIAMTTLQKSLITVALCAAAGSSFYEAHQASQQKEQLIIVKRQQAPLAQQVQQLIRERDASVQQLALLRNENERLNRNTVELAKLRGEVAQLRTGKQQLKAMKSVGMDPNDPGTQHYLEAKAKADQIARYMQQMPDKLIPELAYLTDVDWLTASKKAKFDTDADVRETLSELRSLAKQRLPMGFALSTYTRDNNGQLPTDLAQLKSYIKNARNETRGDAVVDDASIDAILGRYKLLYTGKVSDLPEGTWIIVEKAPVDREHDTRAKFGNGRGTVINTDPDAGGDPDDKNY